ncbi:hypothetical protein DWB58_26540 [candidate division KSB1 bacterium]|nr:hypothetical protein [candidate division KSB1 bacterium]GER79325.1 hypothetical protein DIM_14060 [Candidatus Denitrolinea symbiosum]
MDGARVEGHFGAGDGVRAAGKDLTLIGLSNRYVRWDLTLIGLCNRHVRLALRAAPRGAPEGRWYEVDFFSA